MDDSSLTVDQQYAIASCGRDFVLKDCSLEEEGEGIYQAMLQGPVSLSFEGDHTEAHELGVLVDKLKDTSFRRVSKLDAAAPLLHLLP